MQEKGLEIVCSDNTTAKYSWESKEYICLLQQKQNKKNLRFKGIHPLLQNNSHINVHSKCYFDSTDIFQLAINMPAHTLHLMAWLIFGGFSAIFQPCNGWHLKKEQSINLSVSHTTFSNTFNIKTRERLFCRLPKMLHIRCSLVR